MSISKEGKIYARRSNFTDSIAVAIVLEGSKVASAQPIMFKTLEADEDPQACFSMSLHTAQGLMDELWDCGIRPSEGSGSAGAMAATQKHLEDMRKLVFEYSTSRKE